MKKIALVATTLAACGSSTASPEAPAVAAPRTGVVQANGARIAYQVHGDLKAGTPLLLLHGTFMSADMMKPFVERFVGSRPVIALDQRGHGASGDFDGPMTYNLLADDASSVLTELGVAQADVLGYSMGAVAAVTLVARHPEQVRRVVVVSGSMSQSGWYPEVPAGIAQLTVEMLAPSGIIAAYDAQSPTPGRFPALLEKAKVMETVVHDVPPAALAAWPGKAMIIVGDSDGVTLEHTVELYKAFGGPNREAIATGMLTAPPRARLLVLPATGHLGILSELDLIAAKVGPFLDDEAPSSFTGF